MTLKQPDQIDGLRIEYGSGTVVLTIDDLVAWEDPEAHLQALLAKIARYRHMVARGVVERTCARAIGRGLAIEVVAREAPSNQVLAGLQQMRSVLEPAGIQLWHRVSEPRPMPAPLPAASRPQLAPAPALERGARR